MKRTVLARPNLKLFLLGAILLAVVGHLVLDGESRGPAIVQARLNAAPGGSEDYLARLLQEAVKNPTPELYMKISSIYEARGQMRKALLFLRQAERLAEADDL